MGLSFFDGLERIEITEASGIAHVGIDDAAPVVKVRFHEAGQVDRFVRRVFRGVSEMQRLRALLGRQYPLIHRMADDEVLRHLGRNLRSGYLCAYVYTYVPKAPIREQAATTTEATEKALQKPAKRAAATAEPPPIEQTPAVKYWLEIELVGEEDQPIPGEAYEVKLPSGKIVAGHLDGQGFARLEQLDEQAQCEVRFPNLDAAAWEKIDTRPQKPH